MYIWAILVIIILLFYKLATWNSSSYEDYLYGFWTAEDDEFCESSEIDSMLVFIGEDEVGWRHTTRTCYIVIMDNMANQGFTIKYKPGWSGIGIGKYKVNATVEFDDEDLWGDNVCVEVDIRTGTMKIYDDTTIYAKLTKQHDTTNMAASVRDAKVVE